MDPLAVVGGAIDRIRREIVLARFIGRLAVEHGVRELSARLDEALDSTRGPAGEETAAAAAPERSRPDAPVAIAIDVETLALADYDHLPAAHVIAALGELDDDELEAIERYERAGRHRRTILAKLEQLRMADPA